MIAQQGKESSLVGISPSKVVNTPQREASSGHSSSSAAQSLLSSSMRRWENKDASFANTNSDIASPNPSSQTAITSKVGDSAMSTPQQRPSLKVVNSSRQKAVFAYGKLGVTKTTSVEVIAVLS